MRDSELIRQPQELLDPAISELIPDPAALLSSLHVAAPAQTREMGRDAGLGQVEQVDQLANRALLFQQQLEDAQPGGVAQALEKAGAGFDRGLGFD